MRRLAVLSLLFLLTLPAVTTRLYASDEIEFFAWLRSAAFDRDVDFDNEYRYFYDTGATRDAGFRATFLEDVNEAGRRHNFAPIGCAILWAPFYAIGHLAAIATGAPLNGLSQPYISAVAYGSAAYGFAAILLSAAIARRLIGNGALAAGAVLAGTPLVYYMYVTPPFSHACSAFAVSLFIWAWLHVRERWTLRGLATLGVAGALMTMVREQDVFFVVGPAMDYVRWAVRGGGPRSAVVYGFSSRGASVLSAVVGVVAFAVGYLPQVLAYNALNGHPGPTEAVTRKLIWYSPHAAGVLFSTAHGLFAWTPLALVAIAGLVLAAMGRVHHVARAGRDASWIAACALVMGAAEVYVTGAVDSWTLAGSFGQRRFVALTPLLVLGLAAIFAMARGVSSRVLVGAVVIVAIWWNVGLMAQFGLHRMDRQRLTLRENAWMTFVVLPREAPALVLRYLTDRPSFYGQPRR